MFLVVLFCLALVQISYCRGRLMLGRVIDDKWDYMRTLVSERIGDWRWMRIHEDVGVRKDGWLKMNVNTGGRWCQKGWVIEDEWEYVRTLVSERIGDWRWMTIHEDVGVRNEGWLKMNDNTWGRWYQKGWVIEDEWEYMRTLVSERMGDWRWMTMHDDVGVRKDGWLKMNEDTWGRWCQKGWVIEDEWEYMRTLVSERMSDWRWMRIHADVGVRKDGLLKMNEDTWGRWCQKGWVIEDEWEYMRTLVSERMGDWRWMRIH